MRPQEQNMMEMNNLPSWTLRNRLRFSFQVYFHIPLSLAASNFPASVLKTSMGCLWRTDVGQTQVSVTSVVSDGDKQVCMRTTRLSDSPKINQEINSR